MGKPDLPDETLDLVDVVYEVTATFVVTASVSAGVPDKQCLAELVAEQAVAGGPHAFTIESAKIIEVRLDEAAVARDIPVGD